MIDCLLISLQYFLRLFLLAIFKFIALIKWHFLLRLSGTNAAVAIWLAQLHPHLLVSYRVFFSNFCAKASCAITFKSKSCSWPLWWSHICSMLAVIPYSLFLQPGHEGSHQPICSYIINRSNNNNHDNPQDNKKYKICTWRPRSGRSRQGGAAEARSVTGSAKCDMRSPSNKQTAKAVLWCWHFALWNLWVLTT